MSLSTVLDEVLDRSVVLGFSSIGIKVRRRLAAWPADLSADALAGRHIGVTGATSGLGLQTAHDLSALGAHVHLIVRNVDKGQEVAAALPGASTVWHCDVGDLASVRRFVDSWTAAPLDALVHNAGVMPSRRSESAQGHELSMSVHVLGPVLMNELMQSRSLLTRQTRVVLVTSGGMYTEKLPAHDPDYCRGEYKPTSAYARSKRAQVDLLPELARSLSPVNVTAMHPGWAKTPGVTESLPGFDRLMGPILRSPAEGADTVAWLLACEPARQTGTLWHDRRQRAPYRLERTRSSELERQQFWQWVQGAIADYLD